MSIEDGNIKGPHDLSFTRYFGGVGKGKCMQITGLNCDDRVGYIGVTEGEAIGIIYKLAGWLAGKKAELFIGETLDWTELPTKGTEDEQEEGE